MIVIHEKKESGLIRFSSCCTCLGFIALVLAAFLPLFVVTSLKGDAKLLVADIHVNIAVGEGIWQKNVCFGNHPEESVLNQFGLTCKGTLQTEICDNDHLTNEEQDHCDQFELMQGMASLAIFAAFLSTFVGSLASACSAVPVVRTGLRLSNILLLLMAIAASATLIKLVKESTMVEGQSFKCVSLLGAKLCHKYGASFTLLYCAIFHYTMALFANVLLLCAATSTTTTYEVIRVPLLVPQSTSGTIIHPATRVPPQAEAI